MSAKNAHPSWRLVQAPRIARGHLGRLSNLPSIAQATGSWIAGGQLRSRPKLPRVPTRITLPANELATGVWLVRVSGGAVYRTFALPIVC